MFLDLYISCYLQNKEAFNSTLNLIDDVSDALMCRMLVDQDPQQVKADSMIMVFQRLSKGSLETETNIPGVEAGFKVPFQALPADKVNDTLYIDTVVRTKCTSVFFNSLLYNDFQLTVRVPQIYLMAHERNFIVLLA